MTKFEKRARYQDSLRDGGQPTSLLVFIYSVIGFVMILFLHR